MTLRAAFARDLAVRYGTPLLVIDLHVLDAALDEILTACDSAGIGASYAAKALMLTALARRLTARDIGIDVCSFGELLTVERAGVAAHCITFHGAGKTDDELEAALRGRVGRIVIDNLEELDRLLRRSNGRALDVLLRLNTGIEAHTHDFIRTAGDDSKFGLAPDQETAALTMLRSAPHLRLRGVHAHIGSQIYDSAPFVANAELLGAALGRAREAGFPADTIVVGGGFGVQMHPETPNEALDIRATIAAIGACVPSGARAEIEPGRAIIAAAGTSLYRVVAVKRYARRTFVIVDGSMADNPRPALYGAYHHVTCVRASSAELQPMTVCGRSCENDELAQATLPSDLVAGDILAVATTGAYTYSMASNYNRFARPAIVAVNRHASSLWARRESCEDVLRNDV
ncbi:MAG TPA: diaminopimelate decarboxylase [Candidatus Baltobacteraceae bacterium]|nr:diaminopimelate decarboxylase [Candidatus Baltobacteraceae bacterium]